MRKKKISYLLDKAQEVIKDDARKRSKKADKISKARARGRARKSPLLPKSDPKYCVILRNIDGTCTICDGHFSAVHLPGDEHAYCPQHCPCRTDQAIPLVGVEGHGVKVTKPKITQAREIGKGTLGPWVK